MRADLYTNVATKPSIKPQLLPPISTISNADHTIVPRMLQRQQSSSVCCCVAGCRRNGLGAACTTT
jgi:hypothetical protein